MHIKHELTKFYIFVFPSLLVFIFQGMKKIEAISLDFSRLKEIQLSTKVFSRMKKLRLLKVYWSDHSSFTKKESKVFIPKDFEIPSHELRYLYWEGYSLNCLPSNFHGENLVELDLRYSTIKRLWKGSKVYDYHVVILVVHVNFKIPEVYLLKQISFGFRVLKS